MAKMQGRPNPEAPLRVALRKHEKQLILDALDAALLRAVQRRAATGQRKVSVMGAAAEALGISRKNLWERMRALDIAITLPAVPSAA